jgi:hypothetical protein
VLAVGVQGVRDPAVRVQRAHEQGDPALPQRLGRNQIRRSILGGFLDEFETAG